MAKVSEITPNPIIERLKGKGKICQLEGYVSRGSDGKIEVFTDLNLETCIEFNAKDILHVEPGEKSTDASSVFVRSEAEVAIRYVATAADLDQLGSGGCHCSEPDDPPGYLAMMINNSGFGAKPLSCDQKLTKCEKKCKDKGAFRQGCLDSCAASHRLCKQYGVGGGGGIIMF